MGILYYNNHIMSENINKKIPKSYDASLVEDAIYKRWEESGFFNPDNLPGDRKIPFTIILPPPNATGTLHIGHAMYAVEDVMIRFERMRGKRTLWLPGTDHAAIATNAKVERMLNKEGKTRFEIGREAFIKRIEDYIANSQGIIKKQLRKMGFSLDWSRERYTLDEKRSLAVRTAFKRMYDMGLIYRGHRVINWDSQAQTTIADDEIIYKEVDAKLYTFYYSKDCPIPVSSTRPETKVGDTAIAVHPKGKWKKYIGKIFEIKNFAGTKLSLKIVGDTAVDENFGTGALGVTPAHSAIDYDLSLRHKLPLVEVINEKGKMNDAAGSIVSGKTVLEAREIVLQWLKKNNLLEKEDIVKQNISTSERTGAIIEPLPKRQWFVDVNKKFPYQPSARSPIRGLKKGQTVTLKGLMQKVVKTGQIEILPERFAKTYFHWIDNLRDWNISRQIWFGHRIPVWHRTGMRNKELGIRNHHRTLSPSPARGEGWGEGGKPEMYVGVDPPKGDGWEQDPDVLDTWFSSGLWTFSVFGWPDETQDLKTFHPTDVLETGYDILFPWVARMILLSTSLLGEAPFRTVYLHGLVRDEQGRKMSKSLDNIIDPLDVAKKFGTDAVRLALILGSTPGQDKNLSEEKIAGFRNFTNKLWNISRFIFMTVQDVRLIEKIPKPKTLADRWILEKLQDLKAGITKNLNDYNFSQAGEDLRNFTWNDFADWYLEIAKIEKDKDDILLYILQELLKMWHPFTPFVTEEIWKNFSQDLLMIQKWPEKIKKLHDKRGNAFTEFYFLQNIITAIRNLKAENSLLHSKDVAVTFISKKSSKHFKDLKNHEGVVKKIAAVSDIQYVSDPKSKPTRTVFSVVQDVELHIATSGIINTEELKKDIVQKEVYIKNLESRISNAEFAKKAPKHIIEKEIQKLASQKEELEKLKKNLSGLV